MMRQYNAAKGQFPQALLFFRMGDFFELFYEDARIAAKALGLTLTSRSKERDVPMAGVPVRSMEGYLARLVRAGHTVAVCDQVKNPKDCKGIVDREVVRVVTPGTMVEDETLAGEEPLFVLAVHAAGAVDADGDAALGLAWSDISTGAFRCAESRVSSLEDDLARIAPAEVVLAEPPEPDGGPATPALGRVLEIARREDLPVSLRPPWTFDARNGRRDLCEQLRVKTLEAFGLDERPDVLAAGGALLAYLKDTQRNALANIRDLQVHRASQHLVLDRATRRTLELTRSLQDGGREGTLLDVLDRTETPMGARLLRERLLEPLVEREAIEERLAAVAELVEDAATRKALRAALDGMGDLERLCGKVAGGRAGARDLVALAAALERVPAARERLAACRARALLGLVERLDPCEALSERVRATLREDPPLAVREGGLVRVGFHAEVDELRSLAKGGKDYLVALQQREIERTGISTLKIGFNRVFGYYIEISHANAAAVPADYVRKQTLKNAERYVTSELKEYEAKVLNAEERLQELEYEIFVELREAAATELPRLLGTAGALGELDVAAGLAAVAVERGYCRPELTEDEGAPPLRIRGGRHPVVESAELGEPFVPNDTELSAESRLAVLTGPNMSGKSTYLRQTALIVILAQMGSFVPAEEAHVGLADRIFTRVGSGDDISRGASTFMVEMVETANILRNATERSLLVLDEVGRGTSTFDGLSIAWAVCEHVHDRLGARCLFATHYHQLTELARELPRAHNLNVAVREWGDEIVFLHRIEEGGTDRSYGIHVARLAGVPPAVLERAKAVLARIERDEEGLSRKILATHEGEPAAGGADGEPAPVLQRSLFELLEESAGDELVAELRELDLDSLPPIEAWRWLDRIRRALDGASG